MSKDLTIAMLHDFYGELLTEKQSRAIDLYYNEDLSLSEIAEPLGVSRQGVRDAIKRGEKQLLEYEKKLGLITRFLNVGEKLDDVLKSVKQMRKYERTYIHSAKFEKGLEELEKEITEIKNEI